MSSEWDDSTHIGQSRSRGGGVPRPKVVKTKAELNAAMRVGGVQTAKKVGSANSKPKLEGQKDRKIDEATAPGAIPKIDRNIVDAIQSQLSKQDLTSEQLAQKMSVPKSDVSKLLNYNSNRPSTELLQKVQAKLHVIVTGSNIGQLTKQGKINEKKREEEKAKAAAAK
ncbi:hypothetical protein GJ744_005880 [Endocarpon pusillum]|uniref:Multiprotein bridging factor 1 N-terminal domain-containing protein n=1 Tax=Endocarpon pusillum TaxID=364733 RepID=A0A8H7AKG7_9EURO|nr:hypothetical protein GJ744_005880 [Endocarpon pusillum]